MTVPTGDQRGARFGEVDMSGAVFRETDLTGVRMYGVLLTNADLDGDIRGLRVNGVDVEPLIEAELDRRHPERTKLRPTTADGARQAWTTAEALWSPTMRRAQALTDEQVHRSVNDEWSFVDTVRHLVFVIDAWFGHAVLGQARPFHPLGLPASFLTDFSVFGIDPSVRPSLAEVAQARADRSALLTSYLDTLTQEEFDRVLQPNPAPGWPPPARRPVRSCLQTIFSEEWAHHQFAVRDLAVVEAGS